ncbi:hypothetical protein Peur_058643 [Populus x canadensis]|jgi:glucan-binding YG repeat protein
MAPASSASSSKEEETNKFSLSAESISEQEDGRKTEKEATAKKLKRNSKGSNEVIARELKASDSDEEITKKLEVLESYFGTDGKETEMKKYFILGLNSLEGSKKKKMIKEYWQWFLCMMDLVGKQNDIIRKHHDLVMPVYKTC